jgi:multidrug efflux system membrane fusion protein
VVVCLAGGALYFFPDALERAGQLLSGGSPGKAAGTGASDNGTSGSGGDGAAGNRGGAAVTVVTARATTADFPIRRYAIGFVSSPAVVDVSARISSAVVAIHVKDGQMVKAGDLLFELDDRALKADVDRDQATLEKDQALLASAEADLKRAKDLAASQAGTEQAYDQALAAEKGATANVAADQASLEADRVQLGYATITAPIAGRLGAVNVTIGDIVTTGGGNNNPTPMVTITQMDPLQVTFNMPESDLPLLQKALASTPGAAVTLHKDGDPKPIGEGTLNFVDSSVDTASGTIAVKASVPNPDLALWPGQYADIVVEAGTMPSMVSVPTVAVQSGQKGPFVYVVRDDGTVELRQVKVALAQTDNTALSDGLKAGERVVVEGQTRLKTGTRVREGSAAKTANAGDGGATLAEDAAKDGAAR